VCFLIGVAAGAVADRVPPRAPVWLGGYRVLSADLHTHSSTWSNGMLTPLGLVLDAPHEGIDVVAITAHNQVSDSLAARWIARRLGLATLVLPGEEIHTLTHHIIAVGIERVVDFRLPIAAVIADIHAQGGIAIAAHPTPGYARHFDQADIRALDGAEICHPTIYNDAGAERVFARFAARGSLAAIGSSDFHGFGRLGLCRTYVFAADDTPEAVLAALAAHRTVVYGRSGRAYGDPSLIALAAERPDLQRAATTDPTPSVWDWVSRVAGLLGLLGLLV
jgi:hypothetical protein